MTLTDYYSSDFTGLQVDNAVRGCTEVVATYADLLNKASSSPATYKIFIIGPTDSTYPNSIWRYSGTGFIQLSGGGSGGGGGNVWMTNNLSLVPNNAPRLVGISSSNGTVYRVTYVAMNNGTLVIR